MHCQYGQPGKGKVRDYYNVDEFYGLVVICQYEMET